MKSRSTSSTATDRCVTTDEETGNQPDPRAFTNKASAVFAPKTLGERRAGAADGGRGTERMMDAKLWQNPCWLAFRLNYLALRYNTPLYSWVRQVHGLSRVEYVVIYSLGLADGAQARDISETSGFPKNTLSRAIAQLEERGLVQREHRPGGGRNQPLRLSPAGRALFEETMPTFQRFETMMLDALSPGEQSALSDLLAKVVRAADSWPESLEDGQPAASETPENAKSPQVIASEVE